MAFSKAWDKKKPKKASELKHKPVDINTEIDKLSHKPNQPEPQPEPTFDFGGKK